MRTHSQALSPEERAQRQLQAAVAMIHEVVAPALLGAQSSNTQDVDERINELSACPKAFVSLAVADAAAAMMQVLPCPPVQISYTCSVSCMRLYAFTACWMFDIARVPERRVPQGNTD